MHALRQYLWLPALLILSGCYGVDLTPYIYNSSPFSSETQAIGNAHCTDLYNNAQFSHLKGKMPIRPGEIPSRAMLSIGLNAADEEISAIQTLESAVRNCRKLRAAAGVPTSATEDIAAARISKLRYGLYKGEIPYAVYNYGVVDIIRQSNNFMLTGEKAAQDGKVMGQQRQAISELNNQISDLNSSINSYNTFNNSIPSGTWVCRGAGCF